MYSKEDLNLISKKGISTELIEQQLDHFRKGFPFSNLQAPATPGNGIIVLGEEEVHDLETLYNQIASELTLVKFVPASGAASRMFQHLFEFSALPKGQQNIPLENFPKKDFGSIYTLLSNLDKFAFYEELNDLLQRDGYSLNDLMKSNQHDVIIDYILSPKGLDYGNSPKGVIKFHSYPGFSRTAFGEHLVEGANYCIDSKRNVNVHYTISEEHHKKFLALLSRVGPYYEEKLNVTYNVSFSFQKQSTDTIAVGMDNEPFRNNDGTLLFRPGGHGALIENLNDIQADIIFIKNIDNISQDYLKEDTYRYKKALAGLLLKLTGSIHHYLSMLNQVQIDDSLFSDIWNFMEKELKLQLDAGVKNASPDIQEKYLSDHLNRPVRICGMVKNEGEPGGGPFWVKDSSGEVSLQIVESSQINKKDPHQLTILNSSSHFNPVDLVCSTKDFQGNPFDLHKFIDHETGFISEKSKDGKQLKALELPGLWNGAMAKWITLFVEVPISTFNPVKTVNDLLRPQHQPL